MQVSFIIPLYNCLAFTQACVDSLRRSLPAGLTYEIILVDDGSTDGTREWLRTLDEPFRVALNEQNLGYAGANNRGAALARGTFLVLLNNDLVLARGWLEPMLALAGRLGARAGVIGNVQLNARTGAVDHAGIVFNHKGKPEHIRELPSPWRRHGREVQALTGACMLIDRTLWQQLGGFDTAYVNGCEDIDLCFRATQAGKANAVALESVIRHHVSTSPGRKLRDEQNSYHLTRTWLDRIVSCSLDRWCSYYLEEVWGRSSESFGYIPSCEILAYALGWRATPPVAAIAGTRASIQVELDRWRQMFGQ